MSIHEAESLISIGPLKLGVAAGREMPLYTDISIKSGQNMLGTWIEERIYIMNGDQVRYRKDFYDGMSIFENAQELKPINQVLTEKEINKHKVVGKKVQWRP